METIEWARIFVKVVQFGGFSKAADHLKIPKSTVSKVVSRLEAQTGTKLLMRTTRSQTLTETGRIFYEKCLMPVQQLEEAQRLLYGQDQLIAGTIKLTAPEDIGTFVVAPIIGQLSMKHPNLSFELNYTNQIVDLVKDGYDLAVRIGRLRSSQLYLKKAGTISFVLVASPEYLKASAALKSPKDLLKHHCLEITTADGLSNWTLENKKEIARLKIDCKLRSNQPSSVLKIAEAGGGVALLPKFLVRDSIASGHLVQVLPQWGSRGLPISLLSPFSFVNTPRVKVVADEIIKSLYAIL